MKTLSIIFPCMNEEENLERLINDWHFELSNKIKDFEMIFVDDCSTDSSYELLLKFKKKYQNLKVIKNEKNLKYGETVIRGIKESTGKYVIWTDSDYSHKPSDFWKLWEHKEQFDAVWGIRRLDQRDNRTRSILTTFNIIFIYVLFQKFFSDPNCAFKLFSREKLLKILNTINPHPLMTTTKIAIRARQFKLKIKEINVDFLKRSTGKCTINHFPAVIQGVKEMLRFRFKNV